jgi:hypothetical protein
VFKDAFREYAPSSQPDEPLDPDRQKAAVLRTFIRNGPAAADPLPLSELQ